MVQTALLLFASAICSEYTSVQEYVQSTHMDQDMTWGKEVEMFTLANSLQTSEFSCNTVDNNGGDSVHTLLTKVLPEDITAMSMYIRDQPSHFDVVRSVC